LALGHDGRIFEILRGGWMLFAFCTGNCASHVLLYDGRRVDDMAWSGL
jgi:hypothetical protein